jgi:uncharacterized repeat protein (TIGR01451 family)
VEITKKAWIDVWPTAQPATAKEIMEQGTPVDPGATLAAGTPVWWTYEVTNNGPTELHDIVVTDSVETVTCPPGVTTLAAGESMICTAHTTGIQAQ